MSEKKVIDLRPENVCPALNNCGKVVIGFIENDVTHEVLDPKREKLNSVICDDPFFADQDKGDMGLITARLVSDGYVDPLRVRVNCKGCSKLPKGFNVTQTLKS